MPTTAPASTTTTTALVITARHITALQLGQHDAALVQYLDGSLDVIPCLADEPVDYPTIVLRHPGRAWADDLVAAERDAADTAGERVPLATLRKRAGRAGTAELTAEAAAEEALLPPAAPALPAPRTPVEFHWLAALEEVTEAATLAEWEQLLDDLLDRL